LIAGVFAHPDTESGWHDAAVKRGLEVLSAGGFGAILSTSPPATAHFVALSLKERTRLPWVADLRDLWSDNYAYPWGPLRQAYDRRVEEAVLKQADSLVSVSEPLAHALRSRHPLSVYSIPNGFPPEEMLATPVELTRSFTITYTGTLYRGKREPSPLFEALSDLIERRLIDPNALRVRFYGRNVEDDWLRSMIAAHRLTSCTIVGGLLPRPEALQKQRESQILLALDWMDLDQPGVYTAKIFEYLAACRPILSLGRPGAVTDVLLQTTGSGIQCVDTRCVQAFLAAAFGEYERTGEVSWAGRRGVVRDYDHVAMARAFGVALNAATERKDSARTTDATRS
jgi:hypothetical protein